MHFKEKRITYTPSHFLTTRTIKRVQRTSTKICSSASEGPESAPLEPSLALLEQRLTTLEQSITKMLNRLEPYLLSIESLPSSSLALLSATLTSLEDASKAGTTTLQEQIAEQVCLSVVGESYSRWDSTSTYYPTLIFLFKEEGASSSYRKSQIKLRAPLTNDALTDLILQQWVERIKLIENVHYLHGTSRFNYVSTDKRFKTTIFASSLDEVTEVFKALFSVINEPFEDANLSITYGRNRSNSTKRLRPLNGIALNEKIYSEPFPVQLNRVVLLVNGLRTPLQLFKAKK